MCKNFYKIENKKRSYLYLDLTWSNYFEINQKLND